MIGLVACCKTKLDHAAPARELYVSPLFKLSLAYALSQCEAVYVISAKLGLIELDTVIEPYEMTLSGATRVYRWAWGEGVVRSLAQRHGTSFEICALAGQLYIEPIALARRDLGVTAPIREPLGGMQIGQRLAFLNRQIRKAA